MEKEFLILLEGITRKQLNEEVYSHIIGKIDLSTGIFTGIELLNIECGTNEYSLLQFLQQINEKNQKCSLVTGYYNGKRLNYTILEKSTNILFGNFKFRDDEKRFSGREKRTDLKKKRNNRFISRYHVMLKMLSLEHQQTGALANIYEQIKQILTREENNWTWKGIQYSVKNMIPKERGSKMKKNTEGKEGAFKLTSLYLYMLHFLGQNDLNSAQNLLIKYLETNQAKDYEKVLYELIKIGYLENDMSFKKMHEALQIIQKGNQFDISSYQKLCHQAFVTSRIELGNTYFKVISHLEAMKKPTFTNAELAELGNSCILVGPASQEKDLKPYPGIISLPVGNKTVFKVHETDTIDMEKLRLQAEQAYSLGQYEECIQLFLQIVIHSQTLDSDICFKLGDSYMKTGDAPKAYSYFTVGKELNSQRKDDYRDAMAELEEADFKPIISVDLNEFNQGYPIEETIKEMATLVVCGRKTEVDFDHSLTEEEQQILKLAVAKLYFQDGRKELGNQYLKRVEGKPKSERVKQLLDQIQRDKGLLKYRGPVCTYTKTN